MAVLRFRLVVGLSSRQSGYSSRSAHLGSVVDTVSLGQDFSLSILDFSCTFHQCLISIHSSITGAIYVGHLESKERLRIQPAQLFNFS